MTITQSPWVVWGVLSLALFGAWFLATRARDGARGAAGWLADWLHGRIAPPWWWKPWLYRFRGDDQDEITEDELEADEEMGYFDGLPPERTWEQMTSHQLPVVDPYPHRSHLRDLGYQWNAPERERRPPAWEVDHRAHYVAMGFEYPSGLMARVREAAP